MKLSFDAEPLFTKIEADVAEIEFAVSVTVIVLYPAVLRVMLKVRTPASPLTKVVLTGSPATESEELKVTVPV